MTMIYDCLWPVFFGLNLAVSPSLAGKSPDNLTDLYLIGLFPVTGPWDRGKALLPAARLAVDDINNRSDILRGYRLHMVYNDTKCDAGLSIKALADNVYHPPTKIMIIGAGCSTVSQAVAQAARHWNLIQISYVSVSPALSNEERYPNFFRLVTSESVLNEARMEIFKHFKWRKIAMLHQDYQIFSTMMEDLAKRVKDAKFEILAQAVFNDNPETAILRLKEADARIIVGGVYPEKARKVFCAAYNAGLYGKHVWITTSAVSNSKWWEETDESINCTRNQLMEVANGTLMLHNIWSSLDEKDLGFTGMSLEKFRKMTNKTSGYNRAPSGYDAVWAAAIALNKTMTHLRESGNGKTLADFSYDDQEITDVIKSKLLQVNFTSVSGQVAFDSNGDGIRLVGVEMIRGSTLSRVGKYDKMKPEGQRLEINATWNGKVPTDSVQTERVVYSLSATIYIIITIFAGLGIILALVFLTFNVFYRNIKVIRISSPNINNIILAGCILAYLSVFTEDINNTMDSVYCRVKIFLLLLAFSLSFGSLFAKTWRIHKIFTASLQMKRHSIQDHILCLMILGLVCVNSAILCIWFVGDPQKMVTRDIPDKTEIRSDVVIQYVSNYCWSSKQSYFLVAILVVQGILLLLGVFLAWETRKVRFSTLNESRYIGMCIYNVVVLGVIGVLVSYSLSNNASLVYVIISCITILCTTVTQCLLFVPKILAYRKFASGESMDLTITCTLDQVITVQAKTTSTATQTSTQTDSSDEMDMGSNERPPWNIRQKDS